MLREDQIDKTGADWRPIPGVYAQSAEPLYSLSEKLRDAGIANVLRLGGGEKPMQPAWRVYIPPIYEPPWAAALAEWRARSKTRPVPQSGVKAEKFVDKFASHILNIDLAD